VHRALKGGAFSPDHRVHRGCKQLLPLILQKRHESGPRFSEEGAGESAPPDLP